jgi:hypothetical protein
MGLSLRGVKQDAQAGLVRGRLLDVVDHHDVDVRLGRLHLEPHLFLQRGIQAGQGIGIIWIGRIDMRAERGKLRLVRLPVEVEVVAACEVCLVDNGLVL